MVNLTKYKLAWVLSLTLILMSINSIAQTFPTFLHGTWKVENAEVYEHWDVISETSMKGFSYQMKDNKIQVSEYLSLSLDEQDLIYTALVLNQNQGRGIEFKLDLSQPLYVFENPEHDFPKKIVYQKLSDSEIMVTVSDGNKKGFSYKMHKQ